MSYDRKFPFPWTPMHTNVPMLGSCTSMPGAPNGCRNRMLIGGAVLVGLAAAFAFALPTKTVRRNPRRRRTSRRPARRRTSRRRTSARKRTSRRRTSKRLTSASRTRLAKRHFVFPARRAWPLDTKRRARAAVSSMQMGRVRNATDFNKIRNKIRQLWPEVWDEYGHGVTWAKSKKAKTKAARSRRRPRRRRAA